MIYKYSSCSPLLDYRVDRSELISRIGRTLGGFHHRVYHQLENIHLKEDVMGRWIYPPLDVSMKKVGMEEVDTYVLSHHNTAARSISTWQIL